MQGDPLELRGISAITPRVANAMHLGRGLIVLDEDLADYHSPNADRNNVILETRYSEVAARLKRECPGSVAEIERAVDALLLDKNQKRASLGKPPMADYYRFFCVVAGGLQGRARGFVR